MVLQRLKMGRSPNEPQTFKSRMLAAARYEPKRSMSNLRLVGSAVSISLGMALAYASVFYVPAFVNFEEAMHVVGIDRAQKPLVPKVKDSELNRWGVMRPYVEMFQLPRGYMRAGQKLHVEYDISAGTELELTIRRCVSYPVVEVYRCDVSRDQTVKITQPLQGAQTFRVSEPGFYYYSGKTTNRDGSSELRPFAVSWKRRH